jgi:methyl-accepting chemotaxis protein
MKVKNRILMLVASLLVLAAVMGAVCLTSLNATVGGLKTVYLDRVVPLRDLKLISDAYAVSIVDASHKARNGNFSPANALTALRGARVEIDKVWKGYLATSLIPEEQTLIAEITPLLARADAPLDRLEKILADEDSGALDGFVKNELYQLIDPISDSLAKLIEVQLSESKRQYALGVEHYEFGFLMVCVLLAAALLAGIAQSYVMANYLSKNLGAEPNELGDFARQISNGDLKKITFPQAPRGVLSAVETMRSSLHHLVGQIAFGSEQIEAATTQLAASAEQVTSTAGQQSGIASNMAAAMEQLSVSISHIAESARTAESVALNVRENSASGVELVGRLATEIQTISTMVTQSSGDIDHLADQSHRINSIVEVIRGIAEQTNLLALNAAIEAARAGEQGRGFAVVADEVRNLAARTAQSTGEIVGLVDAINKGMDQAKFSMDAGCSRIALGLELVAQTGASMAGINGAVGENLQAVAAIAHSLAEQRAAGDDVARNIERVAQIVEENTEAQSGINASAKMLNSLADDLFVMTRKFSL